MSRSATVTHAKEIPIEEARRLFTLTPEGDLLRNLSHGRWKAGGSVVFLRLDPRAQEFRAKVWIKGSEFQAPRVIWALANGRSPDPRKVIDHIDRNTLNNAPSNLREVTRHANSVNREFRPAAPTPEEAGP